MALPGIFWGYARFGARLAPCLYFAERRRHVAASAPGTRFITSPANHNGGGSRCGRRENCRHCVQRRRTGRSNRTTEAVRPDLHGSASRRGRDGEDGRCAFGRTAAGWGDRAGRRGIGREGRGGQEEGGLCGNVARPSRRAKPGELCGVIQFDRESQGQGNVLQAPRNARGREKGLLPASERPGSCGSDAGGAAAFEIADAPATEWFGVERRRAVFRPGALFYVSGTWRRWL